MNTTNTSGATQTSLVDTLLSALFPFVPLLVAIVLVISALIALHYLLLAKQSHLTSEQKLPRQVGMLVLTIIGAVVIAMTLPVSESTRKSGYCTYRRTYIRCDCLFFYHYGWEFDGGDRTSCKTVRLKWVTLSR